MMMYEIDRREGTVYPKVKGNFSRASSGGTSHTPAPVEAKYLYGDEQVLGREELRLEEQKGNKT